MEFFPFRYNKIQSTWVLVLKGLFFFWKSKLVAKFTKLPFVSSIDSDVGVYFIFELKELLVY